MKRLLLALGAAGLLARPVALRALTDAEAQAGRAVVADRGAWEPS